MTNKFSITYTRPDGKSETAEVVLSNFDGSAEDAKKFFEDERRTGGQNITVTDIHLIGAISNSSLKTLVEQVNSGQIPENPAVV